MAIFNVLFFLVATLCLVGTCSRNKALNEYKEGCTYKVQGNAVYLSLSNGVNVKLQFGEISVKIKDAYLVSTITDQTQIVLFIQLYLQGKGKELSRTTTDCVGEYRLHCALYHMGYKKEHTKDFDLEYDNDARWYVNVCSRVIGWTGL